MLDSTPKSIKIKGGEGGQTLTFINKSTGGLELIKVNEADKTQRIPGVTFEIRKMDGGLVQPVTTGDNGRIYVNLDAGNYYAVELEAAKGFQVDNTPWEGLRASQIPKAAEPSANMERTESCREKALRMEP